MRIFFALLLLGALGFQPAVSQPLRIAAWQLDELIPPGPANVEPEVDADRLKSVAAALKTAKADVIFLYGLGDRKVAGLVAGYLKPPNYNYGWPSNLRRNGGNTPFLENPVVIFSRHRTVAARTIEWRVSGRIDLPGGFTFAAFSQGTNAVCVYSVHWPENLTNAGTNMTEVAFARKRELAAQYLVNHVQWIAYALTNESVSVFITGNYNADADAVGDTGIWPTLEKAGFKLAVADGAKDRAMASLTNSPAVLNPVFVKQLDFASPAQLVARKGFLDPMLLCEVNFSRPESPTLAAAAAPARGRLTLNRQTLWWSAGGVAALLVGVVLFRTLREQRMDLPVPVSRRGNDSMVVDLGQLRPTPAEVALSNAEAQEFGNPVTETSTGQTALWQARTLQAEMRANPAGAAAVRAGLMPHLSRLMREKLFVWLSAQRSQLIDSHETGTKQVLSLEERLERIQGQFQQKLISQEERILELERELQARDKIIRALNQLETDSDDSEKN